MCGKLGRDSFIKTLPNERLDTKGNQNKGIIKDLFYC